MCRHLVLVTLLCVTTPAVALAGPDPAAERRFPYKAYVLTDDTPVRSGPADTDYPTEKLKAGMEVEVYRHHPGGWCAIRPLESSFSWVSGRDLKVGDDGLAEVTGDRVAVAVGSQLSDARDVTQVHLDRGEIVALRGTKQPVASPAGAVWYKITPPSGEFRWILRKDIDPDPGAVSKLPTGLQAAFHAELDEVNAQLSITLVEEPTAWSLGELSRRAQLLLGRAQTPLEQRNARLLADRIALAEDIKQRFATLKLAGSDATRRREPLAAPAGTQALVARPQATLDRFDGVGRLRAVVPAKLGAPRYALVDERGNVRCYVNPAPDVNLSYYVGRRVGINGTRTSAGDQQAELVTARNVTATDSRLR